MDQVDQCSSTLLGHLGWQQNHLARGIGLWWVSLVTSRGRVCVDLSVLILWAGDVHWVMHMHALSYD